MTHFTTNNLKTRGTQPIVDLALRAKGLTLTNGNAVLFPHVATGLVRGIMCQVPNVFVRYQVLGTLYQVSAAKYLAPGARYVALGTSTRYLVP